MIEAELPENYLISRKQYIQISNIKNRFNRCRMQSSPGINIRSSLIIDICKEPTIYLSNPIMLADGTILFQAEQSTKKLLDTVNIKLQKISQWFIFNKLSLNVTKTKYSFFQKPSTKDNIPLVFPKLSIFNNEIKRSESITF